MPFVKGDKNAGRPKGSANKETKKIRDWIGTFLDGHTEMLEAEILKLEGRDKVQAVLSLLEYSVPKLARTELVSDEDTGFIVKVITHKDE